MNDVQGDPVVAAFFTEHGVRPEPSRITATDWLATALNRQRLGLKRIVDLSCYHKAVTRNLDTMTCPRCVELMKHGFDYEAWLRGISFSWPYDGLIWRKDPCRQFNERTDLAGRFIEDPEEACSPECRCVVRCEGGG